MTTSRARVRTLAALATAAALVLSGCGALQPGTAVRVGDDRILQKDVDALAEAICSAEVEGFEAQGVAVPGRYLRAEAAFRFFVELAARQFAEERDVNPRPAYSEALSAARPVLDSLPEEQRDAYAAGVRADAYATAVVTSVGEESLREQGADDPAQGAAQQEGWALLQEWLSTVDLEFDPRMGLALTEEGFAQVDTDTSFPLSDFAITARAEQPDQAWATSLPAALRCG